MSASAGTDEVGIALPPIVGCPKPKSVTQALHPPPNLRQASRRQRQPSDLTTLGTLGLSHGLRHWRYTFSLFWGTETLPRSVAAGSSCRGPGSSLAALSLHVLSDDGGTASHSHASAPSADAADWLILESAPVYSHGDGRCIHPGWD